MTPQELKNSILQLAIQGKLVEQRSEEGAAEELFAQIQAEKQQLIRDGKIKKEKPLPEITEAEKPFDIPESWMWVRLGDCTGYAQSKEKVSSNDIQDTMWSLDLEDIEKATGKIVNHCAASERTIVGDKVQFHKGQILYSKLRPYLKKILVAPSDGICSPEIVPFFAYGNINAQYLVAVLKAPHVDYVINSVTYGVKMPRVGTDTMVNLLIPLPPLAEQKRIVAKIEELLPYIDRYEQAWSKLEDFNKRFPTDMQKSVLQMAIQGKLVGQRPEEGTGEDLYKQIQAEKQKLIKEGKIKKEKPLPEITEDEIPFDIPETWKWTYINDIANVTKLAGFEYTEHMANSIRSEGEVPIVRAKNIKPNRFIENKDEFISMELSKKLDRCALDTRCILMTFIGAGIGEVAIYENHRRSHLAPNVAKIVPHVDINDFALFYLMSPFGRQEVFQFMKQTAQPSLSMQTIRQVRLPLPPLAEQKRIVAKLEEILPLCEKLK